MQYLGETARQSVAATAIDALRSIRATTAVAKVRPIKIKAESQIVPGFKGGQRHLSCLRIKGTGAEWQPDAVVTWATEGAHLADCRVYSYVEDRGPQSKKHYIVATSPQAARAAAKKKEKARIYSYRGLAKIAIGQMMQRAYNKPVPPQAGTSAKARRKASNVVTMSESANDQTGQYMLTLYDNLLYALEAIYGGKGAVDMAIKKAMNKITATINRKIKDGKTFFGAEKLPTPFPELATRKRK